MNTTTVSRLAQRTDAEFFGKVALVIGGTSGIGRSSALAFAAQGARVILAGRREAEGLATVAEIRAAGGQAEFFRADVADEAQVAALVAFTEETYGRLDIAFNNAGVEGTLSPVTEVTVDNFRHTFDINVLGTLLALKHEIPALRRSGGGSIINVSSIAGLVGIPGAAVYVASKHAVLGLTKAAALEVAQQGIRINAVSPAAIDTGMLDRFTGGDPARKEAFGAMHPIGRYGQPGEIADAVLFLASERASFITGQSLTVDGGFTAQ